MTQKNKSTLFILIFSLFAPSASRLCIAQTTLKESELTAFISSMKDIRVGLSRTSRGWVSHSSITINVHEATAPDGSVTVEQEAHQRMMSLLDQMIPSTDVSICQKTRHDDDTDTIDYLLVTASQGLSSQMPILKQKQQTSDNLAELLAAVPEAIQYSYASRPPVYDPATGKTLIGIGHFFITQQVDTTKWTDQPFRTTDFCQYVKDLMNQDFVTLRKVHYKHGSDETFGLHYILPSGPRADGMLSRLQQAIHDYMALHPSQPFDQMLHTAPDLQMLLMAKEPSADRVSKSNSPTPHNFTIFSHNGSSTDEHIHILFLNTQGELWIPAEWKRIKGRDDTTITYHEDN